MFTCTFPAPDSVWLFFNIPSLFQMEMVKEDSRHNPESTGFRDHCQGLRAKWFTGKKKKKKIHLPMQETRVWSLGPEDPLEKEMATHCSILTWKIPWTEEPGGLQSVELQKSWTQLSTTGTVRACCRLFSGQRQQVFAFYKDEMYRDTPNSNSRPQDFSFL